MKHYGILFVSFQSSVWDYYLQIMFYFQSIWIGLGMVVQKHTQFLPHLSFLQTVSSLSLSCLCRRFLRFILSKYSVKYFFFFYSALRMVKTIHLMFPLCWCWLLNVYWNLQTSTPRYSWSSKLIMPSPSAPGSICRKLSNSFLQWKALYEWRR